MLSIIIVSYNTSELLDQCLHSIEKHCEDAQTIVVDNGSRDGSVDMVRTNHPEVQLIEAGGNIGFAGANNRGIDVAEGDFICLLNSDTVLEDDTLSRCVERMRQTPRLGAVSPSLLGVDGKQQRAYHAFPNMHSRISRALSHNRETTVPDPSETGWLAGTALLIRRTALNDIGGRLDGAYWMYWEDADISARLLASGWKVEEFTEGHIRHYGGASGGGPDAARRGDLFAHYAWGEHRWFFEHRPFWESATVWILDFLDLFRKTARGLLRTGRRHELAHARILARVLGYRLCGRRPPIPA